MNRAWLQLIGIDRDWLQLIEIDCTWLHFIALYHTWLQFIPIYPNLSQFIVVDCSWSQLMSIDHTWSHWLEGFLIDVCLYHMLHTTIDVPNMPYTSSYKYHGMVCYSIHLYYLWLVPYSVISYSKVMMEEKCVRNFHVEWSCNFFIGQLYDVSPLEQTVLCQLFLLIMT
jgi:hypothetical protein